MDFVQNIMTALPVLLTLGITQMIKAADLKDDMKRYYFFIAILVGFVIGAGFSTGVNISALNWVQIARDGIQNSVVSVFIVMFKRPLGVKLPGDTGFVQGQFFGYKE